MIIFSYDNYKLQFSFDLDNNKMFSLVDFTNKKILIFLKILMLIN
jgi:hypothetical protein